MRAEIRADRVLNARVARPIAPPAALRFHQLPQTGREMGMKVFAGNMLCGVGETSCEHPCEAFHTITETERFLLPPSSSSSDEILAPAILIL